MDLPAQWYAPIIGYGFSVFASAILVHNLIETVRKSTVTDDSSYDALRAEAWHGSLFARLEGVLYVAFLQLNLGLLIGVWLALKAGGQWKRWADPGDEKTHRPPGWALFNVFLIGNALTILYSLFGFRLIAWVEAGHAAMIFIAALLVTAATLGFWVWIPSQRSAARE